MKKRIFVGIGISEKLAKEILKQERPWRESLPEHVRWLKEENFHITLIPPWYEDKKNIRRVIEKIKSAAAGCPRFEMKFEKAEYGSDKKSPRLIWATGKTPEEIEELKEKLECTLGKKNEGRDFLLHLTIARFRSERFSEFAVKNFEEKINWRDWAETVIIFESKLAQLGAEYLKLAEIKFKK